jgi:hypothetical protein
MLVNGLGGGSGQRDLAADDERVVRPHPASSAGNAAALWRREELRAHIRGGRYFKYRPPLGHREPSDRTVVAWIRQSSDRTCSFSGTRAAGPKRGRGRGGSRPAQVGHGTWDGVSSAQQQRSSTVTTALLEDARRRPAGVAQGCAGADRSVLSVNDDVAVVSEIVFPRARRSARSWRAGDRAGDAVARPELIEQPASTSERRNGLAGQ